MVTRALISCDTDETRAALLEGGRLVNLEIETSFSAKRRGNIYKGCVVAVEKGLNAAFIRYTQESQPTKEGFLPIDSIVSQSLMELSGQKAQRGETALRVGDYVLVQVVKEEIGHKGATFTMDIALPGRYVVLMPFKQRNGVSRKLDGAERTRLRKMLEQVQVPQGYGVIIRTSVEDLDCPADLQADLDHLVHLWEDIVRRFKEMQGPGLIYAEPTLAVRFVRDYVKSVSEVIVDDHHTLEQLSQYMERWMPETAAKLRLYSDPVPLFSRFGVEREIERLLSPKVPLPSGGSIYIQETEALVAVDVNSGKGKEQTAEKTALETNLEAAREIARQAILRDLGGLIVVDFIDMHSEENRRRVEQELSNAFAKDKARLAFGRIDQFGLLVFSRQRLRSTTESELTMACPCCSGSGRVWSPATLAAGALRRLRETLASKRPRGQIQIRLPPAGADYLNNNKRSALADLEQKFQVTIEVIGDNGCRHNEIKISVVSGKVHAKQKRETTEAQTLECLSQQEVAQASSTSEGKARSRSRKAAHVAPERSCDKF